MPTNDTVRAVLEDWRTILGEQPAPGDEYPGRDLWPVTAADGKEYFLKRLGPWRNLPLADEARILRYLAGQGVPVAEFVPTDRAALFAGQVEDSFVLMPRLPSDDLTPADLLAREEEIGRAVAALHVALARYPWPANSYAEALQESLEGPLMLPPDLQAIFEPQRRVMAVALGALPTQLVHGDLTPENVLVQRAFPHPGFIDFDHVPLAPRVWDIAKYLSRRMRRRWRAGADTASVEGLDHITGFVRGYHRVSPLDASEVEALPHGIAAANLLEVSYFMEISAGTLQRRKLADHDEVLADTLEAVRWQLSNLATVAAAVQSGVG